MANNGHYGHLAKGKSRQGTYVFTADGEFLSSINSLSADRVLDTIKDGLKKWEEIPEAQRAPKEVAVELKPKHRWEDSYPKDGLVFTVYSRDLPPNATPSAQRRPTWNRDSAWFSKEESQKLIPENLKSGQTFDFPKFFVSRLVKLHFVDAVKGQTEAFNESEIKGSSIRGKVTGQTKDKLTIEINGNTRGDSQRGWKYGVESKLKGFVEYDIAQKKFSRFDLVALGQRWGRTRFNGRRNETKPSPIGFSFEITKPDEAIVVPGIMWSYDDDWIDRGN